MKKLQFLLFFIGLSIFSCKEKNAGIDLAVLKDKVNKNEHFIKYAKAQNQMVESGILQEISFRNVDREMIRTNLSKVQTIDELKALYREAGMIGGDKLATLQFEVDKSLKSLVKEIPELQKVSKSELATLITVQSTVNKIDIDKKIIKD